MHARKLGLCSFSLCLACVAASLAGCVGCSSDPERSQGTGGPDLEGGTCHVTAQSASGLSAAHLPFCSAVVYSNNPPAGGDHYPAWAAFQSYAYAVPRGYWVHDLEHGGVVYSYNCPEGCAEEVAEAQAMIDALPADPMCPGDPARRVVLTPDPLLDVRWGASAWGHTLRADCVDSQRFHQFYLNHFGQGPEALCNQGDPFVAGPPCQ